MSTDKKITKSRLLQLFFFNEEDGRFIWKVSRGVAKAGSQAGSIRMGSSGRPYRQIGIDKNSHFEHRLVWLWVHGYWPDEQIDHIDLDSCNNRPSNLRLSTGIENKANTGIRKGNIHGVKGVTLKLGKYWVAKHSINGKSHNIGSFKTKEEAARKYDEFVTKTHGAFARTNKSMGLIE